MHQLHKGLALNCGKSQSSPLFNTWTTVPHFQDVIDLLSHFIEISAV